VNRGPLDVGMAKLMWLIAVVADLFGVVWALEIWTRSDAASARWGLILAVVFTLPLAALLLTRLAVSTALQKRKVAAAAFCLPIPLTLILGTLDHGTISGLEALFIAAAVAIAAVNWAALVLGEPGNVGGA